ncbi:MAG: hypothetical protein WKG07_39225 [Hymenobacter sp.]
MKKPLLLLAALAFATASFAQTTPRPYPLAHHGQHPKRHQTPAQRADPTARPG